MSKKKKSENTGDPAFGQRVRVALSSLGKTGADLADALRTSPKSASSQLSQWIDGKHYPRVDRLIRVARACGRSLDYLILGDDTSDWIDRCRPALSELRRIVTAAEMESVAKLPREEWAQILGAPEAKSRVT